MSLKKNWVLPSRFKKFFDRIKKLFSSPSFTISIIALVISASSVYFQFFNEKHSVFYTALTPKIDNTNKQIEIPLLIKNTGNQIEVILSINLLLELKKKDGNLFKTISSFKNNESYFILSPNEYKTIKLVGDIKEYFFGILEFSGDLQVDSNGKIDLVDSRHFKYSPITIFNDLILKVNISYLTTRGAVANEEREISKITFDKNDNISRVDCNPIVLKRLNLSCNDSEILSYSIIPQYEFSGHFNIDFTDSNSINQNIDKLQLLDKLLKDKKEN